MENYDFIIVGAGSAGCVLADRLTACGRYKVLLIEAGGSDGRFWIKVPLGYGKTYDDPSVNWCYSAQPDLELNGRSAFWPRGRVVGGSSSINAMAYMQGLPHDFDDWDAAGAQGWNWQSVRRTYERLERTHDTSSGHVHVEDVSAQMHPFSNHFMKAAAQAGWPLRDSLHADTREGIIRLKSTLKNGRRWSAADAFLRRALKRQNLRLVTKALVERIVLWDGVAVGAEYRTGAKLHRATANREVIVSAGAVNSPQLLQLSGVGPAALLKKHGIKVERDLPQVGQGLQDHLGLSYQFAATEPTLNNILGTGMGKLWAGLHYLFNRRGPLSVPINQVGGFVRSDPKRPADVQIYCNPMSHAVRPDGGPHVQRHPGFLICVQPSRPTSRGMINIQSADPMRAPAIQPNSLSTNADCVMAIAASRIAQKLSQTPAMRAVTLEGPDISAMSDEDLLTDFRARAQSVYHASCTCRMGSSAQDSVLDARLRVHGVAGLRVIDASAFPNVTSGNTNAPVMMLAARGADMILEDTSALARQGRAA